MMDTVMTNVVGLEKRRNRLAEQLASAEIELRSELVGVVRQIAEGTSVPPAVALVLARNNLPEFDMLD